MRYALDVSYLGTNYHGWQIQPNSVSVQEVLQKSISTVLREEIAVVASGRTDTGVHGKQQVVHFDSEQGIALKLISKVNSLLPKDIVINAFAVVKEDFHARFHAEKRSYIYKMLQRKNPFYDGQAYYMRQKFDMKAMNEGCQYLLGQQSFQSFSKVRTEVHTFNCELFRAEWVKNGDVYEFHVTANRFLRGMVRALVGSLLEVGFGNEKPSWIKEVLEQKDRTAAGRNVPPEGLFLSEISYDRVICWQEI